MKTKSGKKVFLLAYLAYACIYIARLNLTVAAPVMQDQGMMSAADIGMMGGIFFLCYSVGQLVNGYIGDILPPKRMVAAGLFLTALSNLGIGGIPDAGMMTALWGMNGFAQSMLWGPLLRTVGEYFGSEKKAVCASILVSSVGIGSVLGVFAATAAISAGDVGKAFVWPGVLALAAFFMIAAFFPASRGGKGSRDVRALKKVFDAPFVLLLIAAMFHGVLKDNINLWMASYFMDTYSIDMATMSFYVFLIPLLSLAGRLLYPLCLRLLGKKAHRVSAAALTVMIFGLLPLCFGGVHPAADTACLSIAAAAVSMVNTSFLTVYPMRFEKEGCVSRVVGIMDFATYMGAGLGSSFYGGWLENNSYSGMFLSWVILAGAAVLIVSAVQKKEKNGYE